MLKLSLLLSCLCAAGSSLARSRPAKPEFLNLTAIGASDGRSTIECWQLGPFDKSSQPGTSGTRFLKLGDISTGTYSVLPPDFDGGRHNAPAFQYVFFASGLAHITLPNGTDEAWVHGGKHGLIIAADTKEMSKHGHITRYPGKDNTVALQIPIKEGSDLKHKMLHKGACTEKEMSGI
ncbi:hypothetical protein HIM_04309 [Hirsutella minnesotensis 3608]|uniref:Small secreted protein n=1 Tax=Hirsutella minnesotensis 3608 TaxID=1043627 RepID=A0A0F8A1I0_9HYPO|nr:hypothetical protein HIM_06700 [Hirsutella minnesotensis 3608]KJZ73938.1 hypothetical protein HIM_06606 [Hirsutella minnesotensis 3608]KJZ74392.1 hypothetical protein HIM_06202 [Hirsutella minnesotensis 3608]KJZ76227.1 hypothetical protein HIM_04309 [Hirsutella minnesotensis 3608]